MFGMHPGLGWDAVRFLGISWKFLGLSVQAMFRMPHGQGRDVSWPRPYPGHVLAAVGTQPNFQAMFGTHHGYVSGNFGQFLGHDVQAMSRMRQGRILTFKQCPGLVGATVGMQHDFQVLLGNFWDMVCKPCPRRGRDAARFLGILRQFLGHSVEAMTRTRPGHDRDATATIGMQLDFQEILESFWEWCAGHVRDVSWPW
ncbi:Hypothetical predicted protein [Olea europaea subsp. europaea]|uniref:Uncharacterized protein n=1 Tax=Olea europaea subsp. europaea TaxID=158383 RepID=A0A8S0PMB2_OLEEU|nr:Hypothetical predicted protein [Olea europaea subsp. europaea]